MKTRTLMLLALGCGLAIMLAGAVFLFQLSSQDDIEEPVAFGSAAQVGDMSVTVTDAVEEPGRLQVLLVIGGTADDDPTGGFRLIASGRPIPLASSTCPASSEALSNCLIEFDIAGVDGASRVLFYERGDDQARWVLG
jgi:hypothetical protein